MHNQNLNYFCYIDSYNLTLINNLPKTISVIYRNYDNNQIDLNSIISFPFRGGKQTINKLLEFPSVKILSKK